MLQLGYSMCHLLMSKAIGRNEVMLVVSFVYPFRIRDPSA